MFTINDPIISPNTNNFLITNYNSDSNSFIDIVNSTSMKENNEYSMNYYKRINKEKEKIKSRIKSRTRTRTKIKNRLNEDSDDEINNIIKIDNEIGFTTNLNKNTPFINYLINKRICFCQLMNSLHIAAFIPVSTGSKSCFLSRWKWKGRYR